MKYCILGYEYEVWVLFGIILYIMVSIEKWFILGYGCLSKISIVLVLKLNFRGFLGFFWVFLGV